MKKHVSILILFLLVGPIFGFDEEKVTHGLVSLEKKHLYLFDRANHYKHAVKVEADTKLLPHRVYLKYDDDLHMWIYVRTSFSGKIPEPLEALRPGSVATGAVVGGPLRLQRFVLNENGTWNSTALPEEYRVFIKTTPPELRVYRFEKDPKAITAVERQIANESTSAKKNSPAQKK